jgi:hypothetical protein
MTDSMWDALAFALVLTVAVIGVGITTGWISSATPDLTGWDGVANNGSVGRGAGIYLLCLATRHALARTAPVVIAKPESPPRRRWTERLDFRRRKGPAT